MGSIEVTHTTATIVTGLISGFITILVDFETKTTLFEK